MDAWKGCEVAGKFRDSEQKQDQRQGEEQVQERAVDE
jgi:hypothetical protein